MKRNQSGFVPVIIILVVLIGFVGVYFLRTLKNKPTVVNPTSSPLAVATQEGTTTKPTVKPVTTPDPTANWKMYTNEALGFELKYPSTFTIDKEMDDQYNRATIFKNGSSTFEVMLRDSKYFDRPLSEYYYMDNPDYTKSVLGGKNANVYVYDASKNSCVSDGNGPACPNSYVVYVAQNGANLYHLGFFGDNKLSEIESQILSTFKFTD